MKVKRRLSDFPQQLKIYKAVRKGCSTIEYVDYVNHIDELEDCIIQALFDKDNDYYVCIENFDEHNFYKNSTRINLTDEDLWVKLDKIFKGPTSYPMISWSLVTALRRNKNSIETAKNNYETYYGKIN